MNRPTLFAVASLFGLWIASNCSYITNETEQALVVRLGAPSGVVK